MSTIRFVPTEHLKAMEDHMEGYQVKWEMLDDRTVGKNAVMDDQAAVQRFERKFSSLPHSPQHG